jgi:HSP20 family protein
MYEDKDKVVILAQVPGLGQDQIRIEAHQDTITISGERRVDVPEGYAVHRNERAPFKFARSFGLPCRVDLERTTAQVNNGLLTVSLPKHAEAKPREITVVAK